MLAGIGLRHQHLDVVAGELRSGVTEDLGGPLSIDRMRPLRSITTIPSSAASTTARNSASLPDRRLGRALAAVAVFGRGSAAIQGAENAVAPALD